jgi:simple sugar transport system permease protein
MAVASGTPSPADAPRKGPANGRARSGQALSIGKRFLTLREGSIIVVTVIAFVYFATSTSRFVTADSFKALLPYFAPIAILAAAEVFVMINGEIDLSIGALYLFTPFIFYKFSHNVGLPLLPAMILSLIVAMLIGAFNGFMVAVLGVSSFVATLGSLFTFDGLTLIISHATPVTTPGTSAVSTPAFAQVFGGGTYSELFWAIGIVVVLQVVLSFTRWGIYTVAVGGNRLAASEAGVRTRVVLIRNFVMCAGIAGFVGILETVRSATATPDPSGSNDILFQGISAAVIGGTLLQGGSGTVVGGFIGAVFLGLLRDGLNIKGVSANYFYLYLGLAIIIAMAFNTYVSRVRTGSGRG